MRVYNIIYTVRRACGPVHIMTDRPEQMARKITVYRPASVHLAQHLLDREDERSLHKYCGSAAHQELVEVAARHERQQRPHLQLSGADAAAARRQQEGRGAA
jgi:threonine synthase